MQATVHRFDAELQVGAVLTDDGLVLPFGARAFAESGLRHLRPGQRLSVEVSDPGGQASSGPEVIALRLGTIRRA